MRNVAFVSRRSEVDDRTPILVYVGGDPDVSPLLLLEDTDYEILFQGEADRVFPYLEGIGEDLVLRRVHFPGAEGGTIYRLTFRSYAGRGFFDVEVGGRTLSVPFEVRSRKIGYLDDYPRMLRDIADFSTSLLLDRSSPLYREFGIADAKSDTYYEDYLVLEHIFSEMDLVGSYETVRNNKHCRMAASSETVPAGLAGFVDPSDVGHMLLADNLCRMEGGPICGEFAPMEATVRIEEDDYDTPENRMVKDLILTVRGMIAAMLSRSSERDSPYILERLREMGSAADVMASDPWLRDVGDLTEIPYWSSVLRGRAGYVELFSMHNILGLGSAFRQSDADALLKGHNRRIHQIYEYWCYTRLYRCLRDMSSNRPDFPLRRDGNRWSVTIDTREGILFRIPILDEVVNVRLHYNRTYDRESDEFVSYSVRLRPDFSLVVVKEGQPDHRFIVNFDAKYKAKPKPDDAVETDDSKIDRDSWESDIYKMHAYRDALIHSWGSYVLYPGSVRRLYLRQAVIPDREAGEGFLPSVGSVPLTPGSDDDAELRDVVMRVLMDVSSVSGGEMELEDRL